MIPEDAIWILELIRNRDARTEAEKGAVNAAIEALKAQLSQEGKTKDAISRQQAINALNEYFARIGKLKRGGLTKGEKAISLDTVGIIKTLPPAESEPKEGHWIDKGWNGDWAWQIDGRGNCWRVIECSECGKSVSVESNYCPHCGSDMKGEQDGNA